MKRFCFIQDDDSHWYIIEYTDREEFQKVMYEMEGSNAAEKIWYEKFDECRINGSPESFSFTDLKYEG